MEAILTAKMANELATEAQTDKMLSQIKAITKLIRDAAKDGEYHVDLDYYPMPKVYRHLFNLGYKIASLDKNRARISWEVII